MTPYKLMQYVDGQFEHLREGKTSLPQYYELHNILSEYYDYLRLCTALRYDIKNTFVLFPRDLHRAHNSAVKLFRANKDEAVEAAISEAYPAMSKLYGYSSGGFAIIAPKTAKEIADEGHALRHCVGTYAERMAKNDCAILFLRQADNIDKPFVTLRVEEDKIVESRGFGNGEPSPEAKAFLKRWEQAKLHNKHFWMAA